MLTMTILSLRFGPASFSVWTIYSDRLKVRNLQKRVLERGGVGEDSGKDYPYSQVWTNLIFSLDYLIGSVR
jgi:hypothetical protein